MENYTRLDLKTGDVVTENVFKHIDDSFEKLYADMEGTPGISISDLSTFERSNGLVLSTGVWGNINEKYQFIIIPVSGGNAKLHMEGNGIAATYYAGLKSFTNPVKDAALDFSDDLLWCERKSMSKSNIVDATLPIDVKYLYISVVYNSADGAPVNFSLVSEDGGTIVPDLDLRVSRLENPGINCIALGDSITEGFYSVKGDNDDTESLRAGENSYIETMARLKKFNLTNKGVGGSGWLKRGSTQSPKLNAREQIDATNADGSYVLDFSKYDLCTIAWGVNDWKGQSNLGSFDDGLNPETESVYANIRYCLETIQKRNPNMKIIVISPIQCAIGTSSYEGNYAIGTVFNGLTLVDFYEAIKECCEYYGIEFVDMLHTGVVNRLNIETLLPDRVHPSLNAHILMGKELAGKINFGC